ncbi:MAG: hypothetical protein KDE45_23740 [Caldilineaceae bacterium]|nr:hypothetical protein [Caldilineaceae bacterium]
MMQNACLRIFTRQQSWLRRLTIIASLIFVVVLLNIVTASGSLTHPVYADAVAEGSLTVDNFNNNATLYYDLPLLKGTAPGSSSVTVTTATSSVQWSVNDGRWRAFVPLNRGRNDILFETNNGHKYSFTLHFELPSGSRFVRMVYPRGNDSTGAFQAPENQPHGIENAERRLALAGRILQSLTAELLVEAGATRQTFALLRNDDGTVVVDTPVSNLPVEQLHQMSGLDLYYHLHDRLSSLPNRERVKDIAVIADTYYDAGTGQLYAHTALGGERLALFGGSTLYSFPEDVGEIESHFVDTSPIEAYLFPEYGRRREYWAAFTTSIGAMLHEVGHSFGLAHPAEPQTGDIMQRGFDYLNRAAATTEPYLGPIDPAIHMMPRWTAEDVDILLGNSWLQGAVSGGGSGGVVAQPATMSLDQTEAVFMVPTGSESSVGVTVTVSLDWKDVTWSASIDAQEILTLTVTPSEGSGGQTAQIEIDPTGYGVGIYRAVVTFSVADTLAQAPPQVMPVTLVVADEFSAVYLPLTLRQ